MASSSTPAHRQARSAATQYKLRQIEPQADEWDALLSRFDTATVFHRSGWLTFLKETQKGEILQFEIVTNDEVAGYFAAMIVRKGPFRILGSPLRGWGTPNMGPAGDPATFQTSSFLHALDEYCRKASIHLVEICCDWLDRDALRSAGFDASRETTHSIKLSSVDAAWAGMYKTTRNYVRRAEKNGVTIENADSEDTIHKHFEQLKAVFSRQGLKPPYDIERPLAMWRALGGRGEMTILRAMHNTLCIATYLLVHDQHTMWGLATASATDSLDLRPNELIHWRAIQLACQQQLHRYDFCGGGDYKKKYGAAEIPRARYIRGYSLLASAAYKSYEQLWSTRRALSRFFNRAKITSTGKSQPISAT